MPLYTFLGRDKAGRPQRGTQEAPSASVVANSLRERGWLVLEIRDGKGEPESALAMLAKLNPFYWLPPRSLDVEMSLQQMAVMLRSGLTLLSTLKTLGEHAYRRSMRRVWDNVAERIQQGASLAEAMSNHKCFGFMVVQLVRVGEQTGTLDKVVARAAESLERRRLLRMQLLTALTYPAIVLVAAIGVAGFMVISLIPQLRVFLTALGRRLPPITQLLLDISDVVLTYGPGVGIALAAVTAGVLTIYFFWPPGRLAIDRMLLRLPLLGRLLRLAGTAQFANGLGAMLESGITLVDGLRTVEQLHRNRAVALQVANAREAVIRGGALADLLGAGRGFMPMLPRMVAVGETAGTLDEVLAEVAKFHEMQLQMTIRRFSVLIEPVIVFVVGGIVGFVYIAFFVAMFAAAGAGQ
jgi:type IV pilus assembly protein PilC